MQPLVIRLVCHCVFTHPARTYHSIEKTTPTTGFSIVELPVSPILSNDETILFIASAGREVSSFPLDGSVSPWVASDGSSTVLAKPVFVEAAAIMTSDIDEVLPQSSVYFVESRGVVRQYNAQTGFLLWTMDCKDSSDNGEECSPVEADFCVSQDGKMVYYGDVRGNLVAISVDGKTNVREISDTPSVSPSRSPVNAAPIAATRTRRPIAPIAPSMAPSHSPSTVGNVGFTIPTSILDAGGTVDRGEENVINSPESNSSPSFWSNNLLSYVVGASCGIVLVAIVLLFVYVRRSKNLNSKYSQREMVQGMKSNSFDEESPTLASMTPTKDRSLFDSSANNVSPGTLPSIIESPEDEDQASVGFEVGMNRSVTGSESEDIIRDLDDAFSLASKAEENECGQQTETSRQMPLEDAYSSASGSRSVGNSVESDGSASFLTKGLLAAAAAVGAITSGGMLFTDEKKEHGDADRDASNAQNFIQLTPSGDVLSIRSNPAPGDVLLLVQSASGDEKISWQSGSTKENSEKTNKSGSLPPISRFVATTDQVVSPFPSPHIVYPDASRALGQGTTSPNGSVISLDESLYTTDDITTMSLEMPLNDAIMARSAEATTSISLPDISEMAEDCPDDEIHSKLQPGAFFNSRQLANKETSSSMASHRNETDVLLDSQRTRPIYKGVSVRPASRSRAGIFSRRQPKLENYDNDPIDQQAKSCQPIGAPEMTPEPTLIRPAFIPRKTESKSIQAPLSPGYLPQKLQSPPSPLSPPRFTSAGYYVEEPILAAEVDFDADDSLLHGSVEDESTVTPTIETVRPVEKQMKYDPWGNFLTELSKVESQFFNPTTKQSKPMASGSERLPAALPVPPADVESDSDGEQHVPPPAPRTFFA